ncbi:hypothetical protein Lalb_Chr08g0241821 [Lupinus albus]|uniref:Reverse transcriptase domain-containing protein n=1 Tax=Lupinus albus TaxID=3870 RepID=A0A6A4Q655_LUPAL|nr:hypothetical protein Lalb_Chr08g0241821 [Lupinus albus]
MEKIVKCVNSFFICIIPKKASPQNMGDYRPISLIGCYIKSRKIILLANRLRRVIGTVISNNQSTFINGKYILDGRY